MKKSSSISLSLILVFLTDSNAMFSQNKEVLVWETVPGAILAGHYKEEPRIDAQGSITGIRKVSEPTLKVFLADHKNTKTSAVVICPGGGYELLSNEKEGDKVAEWFNSIGITAFVLKYRLPSDTIMVDKTIGALQDAQEAIRTLRRRAEEWNLDPTKIGVLGFSAGGHLASTLSTHYNDKIYKPKDNISARPDFSILIYPVISMDDAITHKGSKQNLLGKNPSNELITKYSNEKQTDSNTPTTFLVHATDDAGVPVENSINYYLALKNQKVPVEMHIYETGGHGFGLGVKGTTENWPAACKKWLISKEFAAAVVEK